MRILPILGRLPRSSVLRAMPAQAELAICHCLHYIEAPQHGSKAYEYRKQAN